MKIAAHETGHMFSIQHGILYQCGMCGSNHQQESDRRPLWFCPECDAKVWLATGADPVERYEKLEAFCRHTQMVMHYARGISQEDTDLEFRKLTEGRAKSVGQADEQS